MKNEIDKLFTTNIQETQIYEEEIVYFGSNNLSNIKYDQKILEDIALFLNSNLKNRNYELEVSVLSNLNPQDRKVFELFYRAISINLNSALALLRVKKMTVSVWENFSRFELLVQNDNIELSVLAKKLLGEFDQNKDVLNLESSLTKSNFKKITITLDFVGYLKVLNSSNRRNNNSRNQYDIN